MKPSRRNRRNLRNEAARQAMIEVAKEVFGAMAEGLAKGGFAIVPNDPTPEMMEEGASEFLRGDTDYFSEEEIATKIYRGMIKMSPLAWINLRESRSAVLASVFNITVDDLFALAEKPLDSISDRLSGPIFEFSISPEFLAAFLAEKQRVSGRGFIVPGDGRL